VTKRDCPKVDEIVKDNRVCLTFQENHKFLSLTGSGETIRDRAKLEELWNDLWAVYFPKGKDDPDLLLLKVKAIGGEYWNYSNLDFFKFLFEAGKAKLLGADKNNQPNISQVGENEKVVVRAH